VLRLEPALLGRSEALVGQAEGGEIEQRLLRAAQPLRKPRAQGREGGLLRDGRAHGSQWLSEQRGALLLRGDAVGGEQAQALPGGQHGPLAAAVDGLLLLGRQGTKRVGERGAQFVPIDAAVQGGGQLACQEQTARNPAPAAPTLAPHLGLALGVVPQQRVDHARLVHGRQATWRCVGAKQQQLLLHRRGGLLDEDRDLRVARAHPLGEPLEAVEDLEGAVLSPRHAQWQLAQRWRALLGGRSRRAQRGQRRAQAVELQVAQLRDRFEPRLQAQPHGRHRWPTTRSRSRPS
jgi:hypothetical protein